MPSALTWAARVRIQASSAPAAICLVSVPAQEISSMFPWARKVSALVVGNLACHLR